MFRRGIRESPLPSSPCWSTHAMVLLSLDPHKDQLRADSLTLRRGESPTTAHKLNMSYPQEHRVIFMPPITTKPSR